MNNYNDRGLALSELCGKGRLGDLVAPVLLKFPHEGETAEISIRTNLEAWDKEAWGFRDLRVFVSDYPEFEKFDEEI